jgi:hypothetical protein
MRDLLRYVLVVVLARCGRRVESWSYALDQRWNVGFWTLSRGVHGA